MALSKQIPTRYGVTLTYHRVIAHTIYLGDWQPGGDTSELTASVTIASYVDQAARDADLQPLTRDSLDFRGDHVAQILALADSIPSGGVYDKLRAAIYTAIKHLPAWSDATDV